MVKVSERLLSLDVFRGLTIAGMILVNNPGSWSHIYPPLGHAPWNGWTPTDFIFPFFLFIVGVAMSLSFSKRIEQGDGLAQLMGKVTRRTLIIFAIGLFLNLFPFFNFNVVRIPGVLQRIAVCYFFAGLIIIYANKKFQIVWTAGLLIGYWLLVKLVPVPGYGAGVLEPMGSLCWYVDSNLLAGHTWRGAPVPGFDPEGLVSTLPAIATVMFGIFAGDWIRSPRDHFEKISGMFVFGVLGLVLGEMLKGWLPINKNLWTSTYSIFMAGMALIFLAMCYWFIDIKGYKRWVKPFIVFGSNAIIVFALSSLVAKLFYIIKVTSPDGAKITVTQFIYTNWFLPWAGELNGSLFYAIAYISIWLGLAWLLYWRKIFIKV
ncbi:MAG: acyltransferase family protein [Candidatus Zhuqueibacterota bacterium]